MDFNRINQRMAMVGHSEIRAMMQACAAMGGLNMAQGVCDTPTPAVVLNAAAQAIALGRNTYSCFDGLPEQRQALAVKLARDNDIHAGSGDRHHGKINCRSGSNDPINMKTM
jgi:aminotransferase